MKRRLIAISLAMALAFSIGAAGCNNRNKVSTDVLESSQEGLLDTSMQETETTTEKQSEKETTQHRTEAEETTEEPITETTTEETAATEETTTEVVTTTVAETTTAVPATEAVTEPETTTLSAEEKQIRLQQAVQQSIPGIVCWGDSLTAGYGGNGVSYPSALKSLLDTRLFSGIPVVNNGICIETTYSIMARANAVRLYCYSFQIPENTERVPVELVVDYGMYLNLATNGDEGLNPVTVAGVQGKITSGVDENGKIIYFFNRLEPGEAVAVDGMTTVYPDSTGKYGGYINIIFMGQNGTFSNEQDLVNQFSMFTNSRDNDRYILVGLTTGSAEDRKEIEKLMQQSFGDKYINMRNELSVRGLELAGLTATEGDGYYLSVGMVPASLKSDDVHLNAAGYQAMAAIIYERMEQLGYFNGVKDALAVYGN